MIKMMIKLMILILAKTNIREMNKEIIKEMTPLREVVKTALRMAWTAKITVIGLRQHMKFYCQQKNGCRCYLLNTCFTTSENELSVVNQEEESCVIRLHLLSVDGCRALGGKPLRTLLLNRPPFHV